MLKRCSGLSRLEALSPKTAHAIRRASEAKQRLAVLLACEIAVCESMVADGIVEDALKAMRERAVNVGDIRIQLNHRSEEFDRDYFRLKQAAEDERRIDDECMIPFVKARALAALCFGLEQDLQTAALEAIYEAAVAVKEKERPKFFDMVLAAFL
jgi:hypothetical protein